MSTRVIKSMQGGATPPRAPRPGLYAEWDEVWNSTKMLPVSSKEDDWFEVRFHGDKRERQEHAVHCATSLNSYARRYKSKEKGWKFQCTIQDTTLYVRKVAV